MPRLVLPHVLDRIGDELANDGGAIGSTETLRDDAVDDRQMIERKAHRDTFGAVLRHARPTRTGVPAIRVFRCLHGFSSAWVFGHCSIFAANQSFRGRNPYISTEI